MTEVLRTPLVAAVIGCAIDVHRNLGPGLLESAYDRCLAHELAQHGLRFDTQVPVPISYNGVQLSCGYRVDFLIEDQLLVELKTVERLLPIHHAQVMTYLRLLRLPQALLINFNALSLVGGLKSILLSSSREPIPDSVHEPSEDAPAP